MSQPERRNASKEISKSCRNDYRTYIDSVLADLELADEKRERKRLIKLLSGKSSQAALMPSKDLAGKPILSS